MRRGGGGGGAFQFEVGRIRPHFTVQQKCFMLGNTKREPFIGNSVTQDVNRPAEIQIPGQPWGTRNVNHPAEIHHAWEQKT